MPRATFDRAREIFLVNGTILRNSQAKRLGINEFTLSEMVRVGLLIKEGRGIYRLAEAPPLSNPDMALVSIRIPKGVICLISALHFYNLTTQIPYKVYVALPRQAKPPNIEYPPVDITYLSQTSHESGIDYYIIDSIQVKMYSREKTIADCFKFRKKIGQDVAIEALKEYMKNSDRKLDKIMHYSKINRVERIINPYMESLLK
jgi:predicted transcriptional regulator of viral defense system